MISFVIPAHDEERLLPRTLEALHAAARALQLPYEVIVVDDDSADRTAAIAGQHGARVVPVRHRQIAATRNAGAREASGTLLVFVDADTLVGEPVLAAAVRALRDGAAGGGCAFRFDGRVPLYGRLLQALAVPFYRAAGLASGCFLFCSRAAFEASGGFDEGLFGAEEAAMSRALRRQGRFVVLRESVTTSGRKLRAYSGREVLGTLVGLALRGRRSVGRREGLDIWYGPRRPDPDADGEARIRTLERNEIHDLWSIDRTEVIENVYTLEGRELVLRAEFHDLRGWPPGERDRDTAILLDCFDRGGTFYGAFQGGRLIGACVLESRFIGREHDQLQLKFLHVSRRHRHAGLGGTLFAMAVARARTLGARRLYVSATPSENTVRFYRRRGCRVSEEVDPALFELEPEDIHMELVIA